MMYRDNPLRGLPWAEFQKLTTTEKAAYFQRHGRPYHALIAQQFDRPTLERLCALATKIRRIAKTRGGMLFLQDLLREKRAMLYFAQPSTRTFLSFHAAGQIVGLQLANVRDTTTSSEMKGESQEDSVRTFSSYYDMIIMRHPEGGFAERIAWLLSNTTRPVPVVNAGSGKDQHPTQALLDIYTLQRSFEPRGGIDGKTVAFVGDLLRGRTVRSLALLLALYQHIKLVFVAPPELQIGADILDALRVAQVPFEVTDDFASVMPAADAIYMTRIQDEWDKGGDAKKTDISQFSLRAEHLSWLKSDCALMHPLPRRTEIATEIDADPRAMYWRQVRNGMWIRAALILTIFERDAEADRYYMDLTS